ncbi:MAG: 3'(2'),5'-bisphosphate nucleotidase CysQ [Candidatus Eremiobacteraeota bacterium]|nr:3'(2'),5'-bisphosphate nucleotidase CysQ [Candidatus Eremiobacteraeota bacterium]MBV9646300.1 3'(2'),5'-bisphosphate nucleotidase CysQ [Candidatus Eremiobacteraeota bacterium]
MSGTAEVCDIARAAGEAILEIYGRADHGTTLKDDQSPLTLADRAAHDCIVQRLSALDAGIPILSEESESVPFEERRVWKRFWLVDPLDGTKEFIKRNGEFTVNIALIEEGRPVLGVVYAPALGQLYWARAGGAAYRTVEGSRQEQIRVSDYRDSGLKVVASRSHAGELMPRFLEAVGNPECVSSGSSLKFCLVADGTANLYPRFGPTMEWDIAAAHAIVEEAGGTVTDTEEQALAFNKPDLHNPHFVVSGAPPFPWRPVLERLTQTV